MTKQDYINSQLALGKTHSQIIAEQPTVKIIGSIRGDNLRNVVAILAGGLQYRLDNAPDSPVKTALLTAFRYMSLPEYAINLSIKENADLLSDAVSVGLVDAKEKEQFFALATYEQPLHNITQADFVGAWHELSATDAGVLFVKLKARAPESTHILIESQDCYPDGTFSDWYHNTSLYGVELARTYRVELRHDGYKRKLRWSCPYDLSAEVA